MSDVAQETDISYHNLFETMAQGVVYQNGEGKIIAANSAAEKILGLSYDQMTGRTSLDPRWKAIHEDGSEFLGESHPAMVALNTGESLKDVLMGVFNPEKESYRWININAVPVYREGQEKPYQVYSTFEDITERIRTAQELRDSETKYRSLFHRSNDAIFIHDLDGRIIDANQKALELFGYTRSEILSTKIPMLHTADAIGKSKWAFDTIIREGLVRFEIEFKKKNDEVFCAEVSSSLFEIGGKKVIQGIVRDITKRKRAEEALGESEARYRELFLSNPQPMWIYDLKSLAFLEVNNAAISHYGYSREEFLSMTLKDIRPAEDVPRLLDNIDRVSDGLDKAGAWRHITKDGTVIQVEITSHVLQFDEHPAEIVLIRDITEQKKAEADREKLQAQLFQAQKMESVGRLAGGVAHDFNNMLGVILGSAEMVLTGMEPEDPHYLNLEEIYKAARRSADLTRQLLAFARRQAATPEVLDLNDTVSGMLKMLRRLIGEDIDLAWMPGANLEPVKIDPAQVDQILANLCVNARDAISGTGKVTIETKNVELDQGYCDDHAGFEPGCYVMLAVSDDGCGMDKETLRNIFEPFFTTKEVGEGTGLGLATIYGIVKQNNGFINVYSEPEQGTTFKIYLSQARETISTKGKRVVETMKKGSETVLLVEDEKSVLRMGKAVLERLGYKVLAARTPKEAVTMTEQHEKPIYLLITDVVMPEMNGMELKKRIEKLKPHIKTLFMSGYTGNVIVHRGILKDDVNFLQKPFSIDSLAAKVREVLDQQE